MRCPSCDAEFKVRVSVSAIELKEKKQAVPVERIPSGFLTWQSWPKTEAIPGHVAVFNSPDGVRRVYVQKDQEPYFVKDDMARLICGYKIACGIPPWDRSWDASEAGYARCSKAAKQLLNDFNLKQALQCLEVVKRNQEAAGLKWSLETVAKLAMDVKFGRLK